MKRAFRIAGEAGEGYVVPIIIIAVLAGAFYALWVYAPLYLDKMDVDSKCKEALNESWQYKDVAVTREKYLNRLAKLGHEEVDVGGVTEKVPIHNPDDEDLLVEIDSLEDPPILSIDYSYARVVVLPLLGDEKEFLFHVYCEVTMESSAY